MPLILGKGQTINIVSKQEAAKKIAEAKEKLSEQEIALSKLSPEVAERRREILDAKRHREYLAKVQRLEEEAKLRIQEEKNIDLVEVQVTNELVVETSPDPIIIEHDDVVKISTTDDKEADAPDLESMTKKELDEWAEETLGMSLDRRKKKADLIEIIKKNL